MKTLVTGATGFVGSHLVEALAHSGLEVRALVRQSSDSALLERLNVEMIRGDLRDRAAVQSAVENCRYVYHLAAQRTQHGAPSRQYYETNIQGTRNLAEVAAAASVARFVYVSSTSVYGVLKKGPVDENTRTNPNTHYSESKLSAEKIVLSFHRNHGLPAVIARISGVMGPRSSSWLGLFRAIASRRFRSINTGEKHSHIGYVSDIVNGLRRCAETPGIEGQCYLITGKTPIKTKRLINLIAEQLGRECQRAGLPAAPFSAFIDAAQVLYTWLGYELPYAHRYEFFVKDNVFDISKAGKELAYHPEVSVEEAVQRTIEWYREQGYL
ncbi:MAG: NAD-dependent epimerase/dehydratase family protein [Candidatus Binatia bacterium]